ncbi:MAG: alpha/beta hydrolase [Deltaproteobacteria bacterium]
MQAIIGSAMDSNKNIEINLVEGVRNFQNPVLFLASGCNSLIGAGHQARQAEFFANAELKVIKHGGHMMFGERPVEAAEIVRDYLKR